MYRERKEIKSNVEDIVEFLDMGEDSGPIIEFDKMKIKKEVPDNMEGDLTLTELE